MSPLEVAIDNDLKWRTEELASLKLQATTHAPGTPGHRAMLRAIMAMLYAHYEGFCKFAINLYVEQLEKLGVERFKCHESITVLSLEKDFKAFRGDTSGNGCYEFFKNKLRALLGAPVEFVKDPKTNEFVMKGDSNLYPALLEENCVDLCLDHSLVVANKTLLRQLVERRNEIAHGRKLTINGLADYQPFEDAAVDVMHELGLSVIDSIERQRYLKPFEFLI